MNMALAGLAILIIGDSHIAGMGYFNNPLHESLVSQGATVNTFGVCGSVPGDWVMPGKAICGRGERHDAEPAQMSNDGKLPGWSLSALVARYKPNLLIVSLGENLAGYGITPDLPRDYINDQVSQLMLPIKALKLPCIWIGPPWGQEGFYYKKSDTRVKALSDYLSQVVAPCHYVDSLPSSKPGELTTLDGVHLTPDATRLWDAYLTRSIDQIAASLPRR
jgi:hypothetical protein